MKYFVFEKEQQLENKVRRKQTKTKTKQKQNKNLATCSKNDKSQT